MLAEAMRFVRSMYLLKFFPGGVGSAFGADHETEVFGRGDDWEFGPLGDNLFDGLGGFVIASLGRVNS